MKKVILIIVTALGMFCSNGVAQTCPTTCPIAFNYFTNGTTVVLSTGGNSFACGQKIDDIMFSGNGTVNNGGIYDASNNLVSWSPNYTATNANSLANGGYFSFPTNVSGTFYIKYNWSISGTACVVSFPFTLNCSGGGSCNLTLTGIPKCNSATTATNSIDVTATGGTAPYTYVWATTPVQTTSSLLNVLPGTYSVTVTDATGCSKTESFTINCTQPSTPTAVCEGTNGYRIGCNYNLPTNYPLNSYTISVEVYKNGTLVSGYLPSATNLSSYSGNISFSVSSSQNPLITGGCIDYRVIITRQTATGIVVVETLGNYGSNGVTAGMNNDICCGTPPPTCPCPTIGIQKVNNGGHCAMIDTIKNPCNKNIVSWTLKVNGNNYSDVNYPLIPQTIPANTNIITGIIGLTSLPQTTIPLIYTFTYADGTTCTVTKQFNAAECIVPPLPCPTCTITSTATLQGQTINLNSSTQSNPVTLKCNKNYTLNNTLSCNPAQNYTFKGAFVSDNWNQSWPVTFNSNGTQLLLPSNMIASRFYTLTLSWYWARAVGDTCWTSKAYLFKVDCSPCGSICTPTVEVSNNGTTFTLTAGGNYSNNFDCGKTYNFTPKLNCIPVNGNIVISNVKLFDALTNPITTPPSWLQSFVVSNGSGNLVIPANATPSMYKVRYYYVDAANTACKDSFTIILNINCINNCNFVANAGPDKTICAGTSTTIGTTILTPNGETYTWTSTPASLIPGTSMPTVSPIVTTTYTLTVTKPNCPTQTDNIVVTVNTCTPICNCQTANCTAKYYYKNAMGGNVSIQCNQTLQLECNKVYPFAANTNCQNNCTATVNLEVTNPVGAVQTFPNVSITNPANVTFASTGSYSLIYRLIVNGVECSKCFVKVNVTCPPPLCTPCKVKLTSLSRDTLLPYQGITSLVEAFTFTDLPANITEVRATVTNFTLTSVDANGKVNDECTQCNTNATTWASVWGGDKIDGVKPKINLNGVETIGNISLPQMTPNKNPRHTVWNNNGTVLNVPNTIKVGFFLPPKSTLSCCTNKANICIKFVFRNDKCEECVVSKCFDVEINK